MLRPRQTGETIHSDEDWFVRRDGTMFPVEYWSAPIETSAGRGAVVAFTNIEERRHLERVTRERDVAQARAAEAGAAQRRIIEAADTARARLARDLHDDAQQQFLNTILNLQRAQQKWTTAPQEALQLVRRAVDEAQAGIEGLRELAAGIHPAISARVASRQRWTRWPHAFHSGSNSKSRTSRFPRRSSRAFTSSAPRHSRTSPNTLERRSPRSRRS
jgi:signal transduction histidine kinase